MKKRTVLKYVASLQVKVNFGNADFATLRRKAIEYHNKKMVRMNARRAIINESTKITYVNTVVINYVRHSCTNYDILLQQIDKKLENDKVTASIGKVALRKRVNELIAQKLDLKNFYRGKKEKTKEITFVKVPVADMST